MMGLPNEDEWPQDSPIPREAFENYSQPIISFERLVRFQDSCAFELLRVSSPRFLLQKYLSSYLVITIV